MTAFAIEKLARRHPVESFDCGQAALNRFLARFALASQQANASQTYLGLADGGEDTKRNLTHPKPPWRSPWPAKV